MQAHSDDPSYSPPAGTPADPVPADQASADLHRAPGGGSSPPAQTQPNYHPLRTWLLAGLRAAVCLRIDMGRAAPNPWQLFWLLAIPTVLQAGLARFEVPGDASFQFSAWLYPLCGLSLLIFPVWALFWSERSQWAHPAPLAAWLGLWLVATLPIELVNILLTALATREMLPSWWENGSWLAWLLYGLLWLWFVVVATRVTAGLRPTRNLQIGVVACALLFQVFANWQFDSRPWLADTVVQQDADQEETLALSQEVFEDQQALLKEALAAVMPRQADRINVFALVYAPYAQGVFVRESAMVTKVLQQRFDARGHVVQLVNHPSVAGTLPWATNQNLQQAIEAIAAQMDREHDVLVVYLSSHGGSDFRLASANPPLEVEDLTPQQLRSMLDEAGIRNRVIAVSACYSGGWISPLSGDTTLVMTAADADHTSYGCGSRSELTFFGRALFDEQLRKTYSFEEAFAAAVPIIQQREIEGQKADGFSNPQIAVGKGIRPVLAQLEAELKARH